MSLSSLISLLKAPVFADSERTRVASYLHYIFLIVIVGEVSFMLIVALFAYVDREDIILGSSVLLSCLMLLWLTRLGYLQLASSIFIGGGLLAIIAEGIMADGIRSPALMAMPLLLTLCSLLLSSRATILLGILCGLSSTGLFFYDYFDTFNLSMLLLDVDHLAITLFVISLTVVILHFTLSQIVQSGQQIRQLNAELQLEMSARARTERMLYQEQKLESIGLLVGGIAHDFNNLFTSVLGQASLAQRYLTPDHKAYRHLEKSMKATRQAAELTRQLLAYTGKSNVQSEPLDLNQLIADNQALLDTAVQQNTSLILDLQPSLPPIEAAPGQLQQVIMNLLINAAQAIQHEAGRITVATRTVTFAQVPDSFDFVGQAPTAGDYVRLTVEDNGSGIPQALLDRIFDPYFTTKESGHGLGLSAVLGIIQAHQGSLQVTSNPGQGSCFQIYFPMQPQAVLVPPAVTAASQRAATNTLILVIEDQAEVREAAVELFHNAGYRILEAANGYEGVALFQHHQDKIGVVLLDVVMPGISGVETLAQLRTLDPTVKVILTSGYSEHTIFTQMQQQRPTDFLPKPYLSDTLLNRVATVLNL